MVAEGKHPTKFQLANIEQLGRSVGLCIKPGSIRSAEQAERVMANLLLLRRRSLHYNR